MTSIHVLPFYLVLFVPLAVAAAALLALAVSGIRSRRQLTVPMILAAATKGVPESSRARRSRVRW